MEVSKVTLVRCPNCDYLLPHDFSLDHCGSCGVVFPGEQGPMIDKLFEKSEDEVILASSTMAESDNDDVAWNMAKQRFFSARTSNLAGSSSSRAENREFLVDYGGRSEDAIGPSSKQSSRFGSYGDNKGMRQSRVPIDNDRDPNMDRSQNGTTDIANKLEEIRRRLEFLGSRPVMDQRSAERIGRMSFHGNIAIVAEQQKFAASTNPDEGTSNDPLGSFYGYAEYFENYNSLDGLSNVGSLENDRAGLLEKLNELKDQLSRSNIDVEHPMGSIGSDRGMVRPPIDLYSGQGPLMPESSTSLYNYNMQHPSRDKHDPRPLYYDQYRGPFHHGQSYGVDMQDLHAQRQVQYENLQHKDAYGPQKFRTPPYQSLNQNLPWTYQDHFSGQYTDFDQDPLTSLPHETLFHQHGCCCSHCYSKNKVSRKVPSPPYGNYYQHGNPVTNGSQNSNPVNLAPPPLHSQDRQLHTKNLRDLDLENDVYVQSQKRRLIIDHGSRRVLHPIAGGAPFIICCICFQLLKMPRKLMLVENNQQKMRCGACSAIFSLKPDRKGIIISVQEQFNQGSERDDYSAERSDESIRVSSSSLDAGVINFGSKDFDGSGHDYQLTAKEFNLLRKDQNSDTEMRQESFLSSSSFSDDERDQDSATVQRAVSQSVGPPSKDNRHLPPLGLPLQEHHDNNLNNAIKKDGKGKKTKRSYVEKLIHSLVKSRRNSVKDVTVATETDVSSEAYMNSGVTHDSIAEEIIEEEQPKTNKRSELFFGGLRENRFRDFSNSSKNLEYGRSNVYVNGQLIPEHAVKKAEKVAGTIQPGDYWYDYQAGFWGVMGHPCLGIIAPYITAFNYPMPEGCAAGNTRVFVNGRELNQGDLDKLSSRGLPATKHRSYIIKISGKVLDAETSEVLYNLGKLAPTVLRARRGFGMKIPKSLQSDQDG